MSSSEYMNTRLLSNNCLPTPICMRHFPYGIQSGGCRKVYYNHHEAIADGALPEDWPKCKHLTPDNMCKNLCK